MASTSSPAPAVDPMKDVMEVIADFSYLGGLEEQHVDVDFDHSKYARQSLPDKREKHIDKVWAQKLKSNPKLFNGSKFRFAGASEITQISSAPAKVQFGLSCYKEFIGLHLADDAAELLERGRAEHGDVMAFMGCPLGIGSVLSTKDGRLIFMERSAHTGEAAGLIDTPGGHPEPSRIPGIAHLVEGFDDAIATGGGTAGTAGSGSGSSKPADEPSESDTNAAIRHELFEAMAEECVDEIGVPRESLGTVRLLGFTRNYTAGNRAGATFVIDCSLTAAEVAKRYTSGNAEAYESTKLVIAKKEDVLGALSEELKRVEAAALERGAGKGDMADQSSGPAAGAETAAAGGSASGATVSIKGIPLRKFPVAVERIVAGSGVAAAEGSGAEDKEGTLLPASRLAPASVGVLLLWARAYRHAQEAGAVAM